MSFSMVGLGVVDRKDALCHRSQGSRTCGCVGWSPVPRDQHIHLASRRGSSTSWTCLETGLGRPAGRGVWLSSVEIARFSDARGSGVGSAGLHHIVAYY